MTNYTGKPLTDEEIHMAMSMRKKSKEDFEKLYGIDSTTRTRHQWRGLINRYGFAEVMRTEGLTKQQVKDKMAK